MRISLTSFILITLLVLPALFGVTVPPTKSAVEGTSGQLTGSEGLAAPEPGTTPPPPGPDLGVANWTSNHIINPNLEEYVSDDPRWPREWGAYATGDRYEWVATISTGQVKEGGRSGGFECRARYGHDAYAYICQYTLNADMRNLSLVFDWYVQNPAPSSNLLYVEAEIIDGGYHYLYYGLNGTTTSWSNSSYNGYYRLGEPAQQWNSFSRNLTADYLAIPAFPKTVASARLQTLRVALLSGVETAQYLCAFVDDVHLKNGTTTYVGDTTRNGNFEAGILYPWYTPGNHDASDIRRSPTAHSGSWSLNATTASRGNSSLAYAYVYPNCRITGLNQATLRFWWYLTYENPVTDSYSYVYLYAYNGTHSQYLYYLLGYCGPSSPVFNNSLQHVLRANSFNTTDSWVYFERNLWTDFTSGFIDNAFFVTMMYFWVNAQVAGSRVVTLIDDTGIIAAAVNGAGFEDQDSHGSVIEGWDYTDATFTVTESIAYAGGKAANMTTVGQTFYLPQTLKERPLNGTRETYLDLMWRLEDYSAAWPNYACIDVYFDDGHQLEYILATVGAPALNSTWYGYINVTGVSTVGQWVAMHRDLVHDYEAVFGSPPGVDTSMTSVVLYANAGSSQRLELLLDDLYLYDDPAPRISNVQQSPLAPSAGQSVLVTAKIIDQDLTTRWLHYRLNGGSWNSLPMYSIGGDNYEAIIPGQPHNTVVEYYLEANDTWGMVTLALNGILYWSYTAVDQTPPVILNLLHTPLSPSYLSPVNVSATVLDPDTGVASCVLGYRLNGGSVVHVGMLPTGSPNGYYAFIPVQPWNTLVEYEVNATNTVGLWSVMDFGYTVADFVNPVISNLVRTPSVVGYLDTTDVTCDVTDTGSGVGTVLVYYRINGTAWGFAPMTHTSGSHYEIVGPALPLGSVVEYYVNASDNAGNWVLDNNGGANYGYTVVDNVKPNILIAAPNPGAVVNGTVAIDVQVYDDATYIDRVEYFVDGVKVFTNPTTPFGFSWDTTAVSNGPHTITVVAYDAAGNFANDTVTVTTSNVAPPPPPIPGFPLSGVVLGGVAALSLGLYRRRRRT